MTWPELFGNSGVRKRPVVEFEFRWLRDCTDGSGGGV